jgi:hypothetical protein
MSAKGIYRTKTPASGAEYALIDYGISSSLGEISKAEYDAAGYPPSFDTLPTQKEFSIAQAKNIEQLMHVYWGVAKTPELRAFAEKVLSAKEKGESDLALRQLLASYQVQKLDQPLNNAAIDQIIAWVVKVVARNA